jgi:hypothetical protein
MLDIFIPSLWNHSFILQKKILCINIVDNFIFLALVELNGKNKTVIFQKTKVVILDDTILYEVSIGMALEKLLEGIQYDSIKFLIPASKVIFKFLKLPFESLERIKMVIPFEIEQSLPLNLQEVYLDCIQSHVDKTKKESDVIVALTKEETINSYKEIAKNAGIVIDIMSVDILEFFGAYNACKKNNENVFFLLINNENIISAFASNSILKTIKIEKDIVNQLFIDSLEDIEKNETEEYENYSDIIESDSKKTDDNRNSLEVFLKDSIDYSLNQSKINVEEKDLIYYVIVNHQNKAHLLEVLRNTIKGKIFILTNEDLKSVICKDKESCKQALDLTVFGGSMFSIMEDFNLYKEEFANKQRILIKKQFITSFILIIIIISLAIGLNYYALHNRNVIIKKIEHESYQFIKNNFDINVRGELGIEKAVKDAENYILTQEAMWNMFSTKNQFLSLNYLENISSHLNKNLEDLFIEEINIKLRGVDNPIITLKGKVDSFASLHTLENDLRASALFINVPTAEDLKFNFNLKVKAL